ncbi:MAG: lipoyl protein ligase domain-containing protein, partial [Actinomycetes bacterium]
MSLDVVRVGFAPPVGDGLVGYHDAWQLQRQTHDSVVAGASADTALLLEHEPVYTAGKRTNSWERPTDGTPVVDVDRG